jgi:tetratricopeptide (TPR) repeat protein
MALQRVGAATTVPLLLLALGLAAGIPRTARAVEEASVLRLRAEHMAAAGRCQDALPLLARARSAAPEDPRAPELAGRCQLRLGHDVEALASLSEARRLDPDADVDLELGIARFHMGDVDGAARDLAAARARGRDRAEVELYLGLVALSQGRFVEAAGTLEEARRLDAAAVEPLASYYEGLAWRSEGDRARAREALERVQREAPGTPWASAAGRALSSPTAMRGLRDRRDLRGQQQAERPLGSFAAPERGKRWFSFSAGIEYDDNVALLGSGVARPQDISDEGDTLFTWSAELGGEVWRNPDWSLGLMAAYYGSAHEDLNQFNAQYPTVTAWLDRHIGENTTARLQYDFGYAWVDADPYLVAHTLTPALFHAWGDAGTTRIFAELNASNFLFSNEAVPAGLPGDGAGDPCPVATDPFCGPFGTTGASVRNRDGYGSVIGIDHVLGVDAIDSELRGSLRFLRYSSRGREYSFNGYEVRLGTRTLLPFDVVLDVLASYSYRPYRHASSFPDPDDVVANGTQYRLSGTRRRENVLGVSLILARYLTEWLVGSIRYSYLDNDSNTDVYDYDRNIVGVYLTLRFGS